MAQYHVNYAGDAKECSASIKCPFGDLAADHYGTPGAAREAFEIRMADNPDSIRYRISPERVTEAVASIEKANRKAEKAGIEERISYMVETMLEQVKDPVGMTRFEEVVRLTIDRPVVKHDGWTFAGTMTWDEEAGLITRMAPGQELIARPKAELCDVCHTVRHRTATYIVQQDGEQKQVGSACLKRFMGIRPAGLSLMEFELSDSVVNPTGDNSPRPVIRRPTEDVMALALAIVEAHGWLSKSQAMERDGSDLATADRLLSIYYKNTLSEEERRERKRLVERAGQLRSEAQAVMQNAQFSTGTGDYATNLRALAMSETITDNNVSLFISAIGSYRREQAYQKATLENKDSEWVGTVDGKLAGGRVTVESVYVRDSDYGSYQAITLKDEDGNILKTNYSGRDEVVAGMEYTLKGSTVKRHEENNGIKATRITRMKLVEPQQASPTPAATKPTTYAEAVTKSQAEEVYSQRYNAIRQEIQKLAGPRGWDFGLNRPIEPALETKWRELVSIEDEAFDSRFTALDV